MITEKAMEKVALFIKEFFQTANVGTGGDSTNPNSNVLDVPILAANVSTTNYVSDATTIDVTVSFTGSQIEGHTIREFAVFSATTPTDDNFDELRTTTSYSVESTMLTRIDFDGVGPFANSDQIDITFSMEVE